MSSMIAFWPSSEHMNMMWRATATPSRPAASVATRSTSTTSEMLPPQWQT